MIRFAIFAVCISLLLSRTVSAQSKSRIVFKEVKGTGLAEILTARRQLLEKRKGSALTGHEWWLWGLSAFDYDRDGDFDLIVCVHGSTNGLIIKNLWKESGKFRFVDVTKALGVDGFVPSTDDYPLLWDFDGDGDLDIAGLLDDRRTPCLINHDGRRFAKASFSLHPINHPAGVTDLNGDGYLDVFQYRRGRKIVCQYDPKKKVFRKTESRFTPEFNVPGKTERELAEVTKRKKNRFIRFNYINDHDLNGDGRKDLIIGGFGAYSGDRLGWYLTAKNDAGYVDQTVDMGLPRQGTPFHVQDVDGDGDVDLLISSGKRAGLYLNDGKGRFSLKAGPLTDFIRQRCPYLHRVFTTDFDNDGDLDLAVSNRRYGRQIVFENLGKGRFYSVLDSHGWDADPLVVADFNNDGRMDVLIGGSSKKENIGLFLNTTPAVGNFCQLIPRTKGPNSFAVGTKVEVFTAGTLKKAKTGPRRTAIAPPDGSPIHIGLGDAKTFDLRVTFPGKPPQSFKDVKASPRMLITQEHGIRKADPAR